MTRAPLIDPGLESYWAIDPAETARLLTSATAGLSSADAAERLRRYGPNSLHEHRAVSRLRALGNQLRSPLLLLLILAAAASLASRAWIDAVIVLSIVLATVLVGYSREYRAHVALAALRSRIRSTVVAVRDGRSVHVEVQQIVPGDVVVLSAGSLIPADSVILESTDLFVSQAALTGESFPVPKRCGTVAVATSLAERTNCVFLGTNVRSGLARCLVVRTGAATEFGAIASRLERSPAETEFDRGIKQFGYLLLLTMLIMSVVVFAGNMLARKPPVETVLFAIALAVGLSPELLPAILNVNLTRGAQMLAGEGVLVRRLNAIENLGSMDVLCSDKTGTLTEGIVTLQGAFDERGNRSSHVLQLAACNAALETGLKNPLDDAILSAGSEDLPAVRKLGEAPFDFARKRVTVAVEAGNAVRLITKGAFEHVLGICSRTGDGAAMTETMRAELRNRHRDWSSGGIRVLAIAVRDIVSAPEDVRPLEREMSFAGFVTFLDRPKAGVDAAIAALARLGIDVKVITGDNRLVAAHVADLVGLRPEHILTGRDLDNLNEDALCLVAERTNLFVEVDPNQKVRIIEALRRTGHVVAFLGDGVNDAPAMHAADTSLAVDEAVDVARETADFVLLERGLDVIRRGVLEGRKTFANTLKYILITTSANLGNMISMAGASIVLPFLPLTAGQILLNNFLSDIPAVGIADDAVDTEWVESPRRWDIRFIGRYMTEFGVLSSLFDVATFAVLIRVFRASQDTFRTAWFVESLLTELVVVFVMRTRQPFFKSRPGTLLLASTAILIPIAFAIPYLPLPGAFGFVPLSAPLVAAIAAITVLYVLATEVLKRWFYR